MSRRKTEGYYFNWILRFSHSAVQLQLIKVKPFSKKHRAKTARLLASASSRGQRVCWLCQSHPFPPWVPSSSRPTPQPYLRAASTGRPIGWLRGRTTSSGPPSPLPHSASAASGASSVAFASTSASTFATAFASAASLAFSSTALHIFVASAFIPSGPTALARRSWRRGGRSCTPAWTVCW